MRKLKISPPTFEVMGEITLIHLWSSGKVALIDTADLPLVASFNWSLFKTDWAEYAATWARLKKKRSCTLLHRMIMQAPDDLQVDHINHNGLDNRRTNLRLATNKQNGENRKGADKNSATGVRGVHYWNSAGKPYWKVQVVSEGKYYTKTFPYTEAGFEEACVNAKELRQAIFTHSEDN